MRTKRQEPSEPWRGTKADMLGGGGVRQPDLKVRLKV